MSSDYAKGILTVLSLVNPAICAALFAQVAGGHSISNKVAAASKAAFAIATILCLAVLGGDQLLQTFGISLSAFQVAGGFVLAWMGLLMLRGDSSPTSGKDADGPPKSLTPLVLFAASPGTITGVITLSVSRSHSDIPLVALVSVLVAVAVTWLVIVLAPVKGGTQQTSLAHDVVTRFMGLIVLAMGVQFALTGIARFFGVAASP